jgi:hypothetical protein
MTNVIQIVPRYIVNNQLGFPIQIRQADCAAPSQIPDKES